MAGEPQAWEPSRNWGVGGSPKSQGSEVAAESKEHSRGWGGQEKWQDKIVCLG